MDGFDFSELTDFKKDIDEKTEFIKNTTGNTCILPV